MTLDPADYPTLRLEHPAPHVLQVTMNRPEAANAQNTQMGRDLAGVFSALYVDAGDVRCAILTGAGERFFSAGGDLKERNGMSEAAWRAQHAIFEQALRHLLACPVPVIAAVNGIAYAGGCELALACDFLYASSEARFALTEVKLGIMPGTGGTQTLARAVGTRRALELITTARPFTAQQALAWGLANEVFESARLMAEVTGTAAAIAVNAPLAVRRAKQAVQRAADLDLANGLAFELEAYNRLVGTEDRLEGVRAFNEKRPPRFTGR